MPLDAYLENQLFNQLLHLIFECKRIAWEHNCKIFSIFVDTNACRLANLNYFLLDFFVWVSASGKMFYQKTLKLSFSSYQNVSTLLSKYHFPPPTHRRTLCGINLIPANAKASEQRSMRCEPSNQQNAEKRVSTASHKNSDVRSADTLTQCSLASDRSRIATAYQGSVAGTTYICAAAHPHPLLSPSHIHAARKHSVQQNGWLR
jgi:hypothetical protein